MLHGLRPTLRSARSWEEELDLVADQVLAWHDVPRESVAICVPTNDMVTQVAYRLKQRGIEPTEITPEGPKKPEGAHIGTMHRLKGLRYQRA
ncbi:hypothetical protein [Streptomyces sp. NPDC060035]|uniref:hypothetical protein n=1 Tax=Streptomyces sp. NPDC060035 TaxID=3347044 RepID=UPI003683F86E